MISALLPDWQLKSSQGVEYFEYSPDPRLLLAFLARRGGVSRGEYDSLNTSFAVGDDARNVEENLARTREALRLPAILTVKQTHSDTVLHIARERTLPELLEGDACFTDRPGLGLGLKVADCLPVYIYAADSRCIGIAHCGWRGTAARLAEKTARQMSRRFSVPLPDLRFALGPCICSNCYEVGDDVRDRFSRTFPAADRFFSPAASGGKRHHLDIRAVNRWLLREMGLAETRSLELCTREDEGLFYSARRDCPKPGGNQGTVPLSACVERPQGTVGTSGAVQSPFSARAPVTPLGQSPLRRGKTTGRNLAVIALR